MVKNPVAIAGLILITGVFVVVFLSDNSQGPTILGLRAEFLLFAITLIGVALLHHSTLGVALTGLTSILLLKLIFDPAFELGGHLQHEWEVLVNLLGLLLGFALLAKHFEESKMPEYLPNILPDDWKGGLVLLVIIFVLSSFLDNIAAAMIGGTIAMTVYRNKVHMGFLAAIVAASNAGGSGSVVGDTTTTMMWIDGVAAVDVLHGYAAAVPALIFFSIFASFQQQRYNPIVKSTAITLREVNWIKIFIVALILAGAILTNIYLDFPAVGVWVAILIGSLFSKTAWSEIPKSIKGTIFLLSLVLCASMMPVHQLPTASWQTAFGLGFVSAVFDNIPLTKLALTQGGYDWGMLAYSVGFGGSMIWFGSSAGVALSNMYPEAKSVGAWVTKGWHVTVAYILGFFILLYTLGWQPHPPHKEPLNTPSTERTTH